MSLKFVKKNGSVFLFILLLMFLNLLNLSCSKQEDSEAKAKVLVYFPVHKAKISNEYSWRGQISYANQIDIRAQRAVSIKSVLVKNLDRVKKGQPLFQVDKSDLYKKMAEASDAYKVQMLDFNAARLRLDQKKEDMQRKKELFDKQIIAKRIYENSMYDFQMAETEFKGRELQIEKAKASINESKEQLTNSEYLAPMDGIVSFIVASDDPAFSGGVPIGTKLAVISDPAQMVFKVKVAENEKQSLFPEAPATITLDSLRGKTLKGRVMNIDNSSSGGEEEMIQTFEVKIAIKDKIEGLGDGLVGEAKVVLSEKKDILVIPVIGLKYLGGEYFVSKSSSEQGDTTPVKVKLGMMTEREAEVLSGVSENEFVVYETN